MTATKAPVSAGQAQVSPGQVELILSQIESLPTLPAVAGRLLEMTLSDRSGTGEMAALIESDQSLSARILSLVRKSHVGTDVQTVNRAVVLLGCEVVRSIVLGVQIFEVFSHRTEAVEGKFDRVGFWRHSLAVGCAARLMAEARLRELHRTPAARMGWPQPRPEEAFVCGLLHDLGKVVFDACFPKSYQRVIETVEARRAEIADVEREVFGVDHAIAGHRLASYWKLPPLIAECMWLHHHTPASTPTRIGFPEHVLLVQAADRLVRQMQIGYSGNRGQDGVSDELAAAVGLDEKALKQVMLALPEAIESRAEILGLGRIRSTEILGESLIRTNAELVRVNAALALANRALQQRSRTLDVVCRFNRTLGDDHRHETVLRSLVQAVHSLVSGSPVAALVCSPARQLMLVAALPAGADQAAAGSPAEPVSLWRKPSDQTECRVEVLPASASIGLAELRERPGRIPVERLLPGSVIDRLTVMLGQAPRHGLAIGCSGRLTAALVVVEDVPAEMDEFIGLVGEWAASWFNAAEARCVGHQLTEELADINRRFVGSQAEVARMRSLAMVGEMAAGAAHELNNPLAVISGRAQLLARGDHGEEVAKSATIISEHAHRASGIVSELMDFAKPPRSEPTTWSLSALLEEIRNAWLDSNTLTAEQFRLELSDDLPCVRGDAAQIRLLFDELIRNAVEAMEQRTDRRLTVNCPSDVADDRLVVRIEDNGRGMTPDVAERAMDPFFSHRPAGRGRGLGLSRAARYAEINGGRIRLSSRVKEGTAVIVELPAAAAG